MSAKWLDRRLTICAAHFCLVQSEAALWAELRKLKVDIKHWPTINEFNDATTFQINPGYTDAGKACAIVYVKPHTGKDGVAVAALLVHEAVHIWQWHAQLIGAHNDHGAEEEAYAIQHIAQELMQAYQEQMA